MDDDRSDWASFSAWVEANRDKWLRAGYLLTGDLHHAEDLLQDALIAVAKRWSRICDENPDAYLRKCMYHRHVSLWRRRRDVIVESVHDDGYDPVPDSEQRMVVVDALARLTPKQRAVLVLRFYEDLTAVDAAEVLGISVGTVKSQTSIALRRMRVDSPHLGGLLGQEGEA